MMNSKVGIIIVAGGSSSRFGANKLLEKVGEIPVILHSIINLSKTKYPFQLILVCHKDFLLTYKKLTTDLNIKTPVTFIEGGETRQASVINGLKNLDHDVEIVAIHDAARPLASSALLEKCILQCIEKGSAVAAKKSTDTLKRCYQTGEVIETINRSAIWQIETPQVFNKEKLVSAYENVTKKQLNVTDDAMAMELLGEKVFLVENIEPNFKITNQSDLALITHFYKNDN